MTKVHFQKKYHIIYDTLEEALSHGIAVNTGNWRKADAGEWVLTDTAIPHVIQILARGAFWLRTCCGTYQTTSAPSCKKTGNSLGYQPRTYRWSMSGVKQGSGTKKSAKMKAMVVFFCQGETTGNLLKTFERVYKRKPGPNEWNQYRESPKFWEAVGMELRQEMQELGMDRTYFLRKMKAALEDKTVKPKDLFSMAKEGLELGEEQKKNAMSLFGTFSTQDTTFEDVTSPKQIAPNKMELPGE